MAHTAGPVVLGPGEIMIPLCLLFIVVRHCPPRWAVVCGMLDAGALVTLPVRGFVTLSSDVLGLEMIGLLLVGLIAGLAGHPRSMDHRRTVAVSEIRRGEGLTVAADLHDFVAHHVTGILVQTQVARMMAATQPQDLDPVLAGIRPR